MQEYLCTIGSYFLMWYQVLFLGFSTNFPHKHEERCDTLKIPNLNQFCGFKVLDLPSDGDLNQQLTRVDALGAEINFQQD